MVVAAATAVAICLGCAGSAYAYNAVCAWGEGTEILYDFRNGTADIAGSGEEEIVAQAMEAWSRVANVAFREPIFPERPYTWISWQTGNHGDELNFYAGPPYSHNINVCLRSNEIHFDDAATWGTLTGSGRLDLLSQAMHESGHALGLGDTAFPNIMYPPDETHIWLPPMLTWDDIAGIQYLYGRDEGHYHLRNSNTSGAPNNSFGFYGRGDRPVTGDWDRDGTETIGVFRPSNHTFYLRNLNDRGGGSVFQYGASGDRPLVGDYDGDGTDTIGVFRPSNHTFYLKNRNSGSTAYTIPYGNEEDIPLAGDWNGDGVDTIGIFRPRDGLFALRNSNSTGEADIVAYYGLTTDLPVVGDWDANETDTIGIFRPSTGTFYLRNSNSSGPYDLSALYGGTAAGIVVADPLPVAGDWDGNGTPTIGLFQY